MAVGIFTGDVHAPDIPSVGKAAKVTPGTRREGTDAIRALDEFASAEFAPAAARSAVRVRLSDQALRDLACKALAEHTELIAQPIRVAVRQGWVTLTGEVNGTWEKCLAEKAIQQISGVKGISNNLIFQSEALAWKIGQRIGDSFARAAEMVAQRITVNVHDRKVILCGTVSSQRERDAAYAAAWAVPGVAEVINRLQVRDN
jgi:osmotically-inducible protein OsmY